LLRFESDDIQFLTVCGWDRADGEQYGHAVRRPSHYS
jgi:hypothetical protein